MTYVRLMTSALVAFALAAAPKPKPKPTPAAPSGPYERIVAQYLDSKWEDLEPAVAASNKELASLTQPQRADILYMRQALAECRPAWWNQSKAGQKGPFRPVVWGRSLNATFDPAGKTAVQIRMEGGQMSLTLAWATADMDNPAHAEHGFSKGELNNLGIWMTLGMAEAWTAIPLQSQVNLNEEGKLALSRYLDFRSNVTAVYYGTPRARRWGLWLYQAAYMDKYAKMNTVMSRKALGAMFVAEVVGNRSKYPSIDLPDTLPTDNIESKLAQHLKNWIEKNGWTLAEDKAIRDATKAFAAANGMTVLQSGKAKLSNGMFIALDPEQDKTNQEKRDAWLKGQLAKAIKK